MAIPQFARDNFNTLLHAAENGQLALMECKDAMSGQPRYVICAVNRDADDFAFVPFGHLESEMNPYDRYLPPEV